MIVGALVLPPGMMGMIDGSTTRRHCPDQVPNRATHVELEGRVLAGLLGEYG